jgi:hypothetical protein
MKKNNSEKKPSQAQVFALAKAKKEAEKKALDEAKALEEAEAKRLALKKQEHYDLVMKEAEYFKIHGVQYMNRKTFIQLDSRKLDHYSGSDDFRGIRLQEEADEKAHEDSERFAVSKSSRVVALKI